MNYKGVTIKGCPICNRICNITFTPTLMSIGCGRCGLEIASGILDCMSDDKKDTHAIRLINDWNYILRREE